MSNDSNETKHPQRIKKLTELLDELECRRDLTIQTAFFEAVNLFGILISTAIIGHHRQREARLTAEVETALATYKGGPWEIEMRARLTTLLKLENILCKEYRSSYFTIVNLIGVTVFKFLGDPHGQRDGVIAGESARFDDMIERIRDAAD